MIAKVQQQIFMTVCAGDRHERREGRFLTVRLQSEISILSDLMQ